jgi:hypothetical protein
VGIFQHRDGIYFDRLVADVGDLNIANLYFCAGGNKDRYFCTDAILLADDARVAKTYAAFVFVKGIEGGDEEGGKDFEFALAPNTSPRAGEGDTDV